MPAPGQIEQSLELVREIAALPLDQQKALIDQQFKMLSDVFQTVFDSADGLMDLLLVLTRISTLVQAPVTDKYLVQALKDYPVKLSSAVAQLILWSDKFAKYVKDTKVVLPDDFRIDAQFTDVAYKYMAGLRHLLATGRADRLRELTATVDQDIAQLRRLQSKLGRPSGLDPITHEIAVKAKAIWENNTRLSWSQVAETLYGNIMATHRRNPNEIAILLWFKDKDQKVWGTRIRRFVDKLNKK